MFKDEPSITEVKDLVNIDFLNAIFDKTENHSRNWFFINEDELESFDLEYFKKHEMNLGLSNLERIIRDLEYLDNYIYRNEAGIFKINLELFYPLLAVIMDGRVRYGYNSDELLNYTFELSLPLKGYSDDIDL